MRPERSDARPPGLTCAVGESNFLNETALATPVAKLQIVRGLRRGSGMSLRHLDSIRAVLCAGALIATAAAAQSVDLVDHNGFEACWSKALTKAQFLAAMDAAVGASGTTFCSGPISGSASGGISYTACGNADCPGGATGCPVTIRSAGFSGDVPTGAFTASGTADDFSVPVSYTIFGIPGSCSIAVSGVALTYSPSYFVTADGNNGAYMAYLTQSPVTVDSYQANSASPTCQTLITAAGDSLITQVETETGTQLATLLDAATTGDSVCPPAP